MVLDESRPAYRPMSSTPANQPGTNRIGLVRLEQGAPFEHYRAVCAASGTFGFGGDHTPEKPGVWFCRDHREQGERRWKTGT